MLLFTKKVFMANAIYFQSDYQSCTAVDFIKLFLTYNLGLKLGLGTGSVPYPNS